MIQNPRKQVVFGWTRAHVGTIGNERADNLAKQATIETEADIKENISYPVSLIKRISKINMIRDWQQSWKDNKNGRDTYKIIKKVDENFVCSGQVTQYFITSHGSFPEYLAKIGKRVNDLCTCGKVGDVQHYIFGRCPNMPFFFHFDNSRTVSQNFRRVLLNRDNYKKLCANYNELNKLFSFIKYKF